MSLLNLAAKRLPLRSNTSLLSLINHSIKLTKCASALPYSTSLKHTATGRVVQEHPTTTEQSTSALAPIGIEAALRAKENGDEPVQPKIFDEFALTDRVGIVSGANRGLGLEMAMALCEAGARAIYCFDIPDTPSEEWEAVRDYVQRMGHGRRLEYVSVDVRLQKRVWKKAEEIGDKEGRMDMCVAAAGVLKNSTPCLTYPEEQFRQVMDINVSGAFFTAQAAGQQMKRFKMPGSIILVASMSGSITNRNRALTSYNASKAAVLQMARNMACELGKDRIRVNTLSPGHIYTTMTAAYLDKQPHLLQEWSDLNPMGRIGRTDEVRGVVTWLASDASSFCTGSDVLVSGGHHAW